MIRQVNQDGIDLIKSFEGFRADPYQDEAGIWTIGYGHTHGVTEDSESIDETQAEEFLGEDIAAAEQSVVNFIKSPLTDNQFSAIVSLVYNVGPLPLKKTMGNLLNSGDYLGAAAQFNVWVFADGKVSQGLVRRRAAEKLLFQTDDA